MGAKIVPPSCVIGMGEATVIVIEHADGTVTAGVDMVWTGPEPNVDGGTIKVTFEGPAHHQQENATMTRSRINLGDECQDTVTGFKGVCIGRTDWFNGCTRFTLQGPVLADGKVPEAMTFDGPQLVVVETGKVKPGPKDIGGPIATPSRPSTPARR